MPVFRLRAIIPADVKGPSADKGRETAVFRRMGCDGYGARTADGGPRGGPASSSCAGQREPPEAMQAANDTLRKDAAAMGIKLPAPPRLT
jgi:hypothetical protein